MATNAIACPRETGARGQRPRPDVGSTFPGCGSYSPSAIPDLRSPAVQSQPDAHLTDVIANGTGRMPSFKGSLTDAQIHALVLYVHGLASNK